MHLTALFMGIAASSKWILVLEDDAVPTQNAFELLEIIVKEIEPNNVWINLNDGAGLKRTSSDPKPNQLGLFRVRPAATRCATAYLVSADLAKGLLKLVEEFGMPDWLPIDLAYQAAFRKLKCKTYWQEPVIFIQGSEGGQYQSNFR
jgi:GR25 family glycosyltransferase involved in LPS biosynthesis